MVAMLMVAAVSGLVVGCKHAESHEGEAAHVHTYTCPHHPEVVQDSPGTCPKCGMKLVHKV